MTTYYVAIDTIKVDFSGKFEPTKAKLAAMQFYITNDSESKRLQVIKAVYQAPQPPATPAPSVISEVGAT